VIDIDQLTREAMDYSTQTVHVSPGTVDRAIRRVRRRRIGAVGLLTVAGLGVTAAAAVAVERAPSGQSVALVSPTVTGSATSPPGPAAALGPTAPPLGDSVRPVPPNARQLLRSLALTAATQPGPQPGRFDYVQTRAWQYEDNVGQNGNHRVVQRIVDQRWTSDVDGSGVEVQSGSPPLSPTTQHFRPGELQTPRSYPTAPNAFRAAIEANQGDPSELHGWLEIVNNMWATQVVPPSLEAGLLRLLAREPGIVDRGTVTDADGRSGVVVTADASTQQGSHRDSLVFDPVTGRLLDYVMSPLAGTADQTPQVYVMYERSGRTNSLNATP
jgi:hypothetical protein